MLCIQPSDQLTPNLFANKSAAIIGFCWMHIAPFCPAGLAGAPWPLEQIAVGRIRTGTHPSGAALPVMLQRQVFSPQTGAAVPAATPLRREGVHEKM